MTELELVEVMYKKHNKWLLPATEAAKEWGSSYSALSKLFGGADALPEQVILDRMIIPKWINIGGKRMWKLLDIARWVLETEGNK